MLLALSALCFHAPRNPQLVNLGYITREVRGHAIAFSARQAPLPEWRDNGPIRRNPSPMDVAVHVAASLVGRWR